MKRFLFFLVFCVFISCFMAPVFASTADGQSVSVSAASTGAFDLLPVLTLFLLLFLLLFSVFAVIFFGALDTRAKHEDERNTLLLQIFGALDVNLSEITVAIKSIPSATFGIASAPFGIASVAEIKPLNAKNFTRSEEQNKKTRKVKKEAPGGS